MPRYYFDFRNDHACTFDEVGVILDGIGTARDQAARRLAECARDILPGTDRRVLAIEVRDEAKQPVLELRLVFDAVRFR
jgi:hypothetical protein